MTTTTLRTSLGWACLLLLTACGSIESEPAPTASSDRPRFTFERPTKTPSCATTISAVEAAPSPIESFIYDVAATDASLVALLGDGGLRSLDGGATWSPLSLRPVKIAADASGYVVLDAEATIQLGDAEAASFEPATAGLPDGASIDHLAIGGGLPVVVADGAGYRWDAEAGSWIALPLPAAGPWQRLETDGTAFLAASDQGLFQSPDGVSWSAAMPEPQWGFFALAMAGDLHLASNFSTFARSVDGGVTWTTDLEASITIGMASELITDGTKALAASNKGIFASLDAGATWAAVPNTTGYGSMGLARQGNTWFVAGGRVQKSDDGAAWSVVDTLRTRRVRDLYAVDGALLATSHDGWSHRLVGDDWARYDGSNTFLAAVEHEGAIYAIERGIYYTDVVRSFDGGASWSPVSAVGGTPAARSGSLVSVKGVLLAGSTTTLGGGSKSGGTVYPGIGIHRSVDGGASWQGANDGLPVVGWHDADTAFHPYVVALFALGEVAYAVVEDVGLLRSDDAGASWTLVDALDSGTGWLDVTAATESFAIAGSSRDAGVLMRIDETGATPLAGAGLPDGFVIADLLAVDGAIFATVVDHDGIFLSRDAGESWTLVEGVGDARALAVHDGRLWIGVQGEGLATASLDCE